MKQQSQIKKFNKHLHSKTSGNFILNAVKFENVEFKDNSFHVQGETASIYFSLPYSINFCKIKCSVNAKNQAGKITLHSKGIEEKHFNPTQTIHLCTANGNHASLLYSFPKNINSLRLDVKDSQGEFAISHLSITPYSKVQYKVLHKLETLKKIIHYISRDKSLVKKFFRVMKTRGVNAGLREIYIKLNSRSEKEQTKYMYIPPILTDSVSKEINAFEKHPLISIIMPVYNVKKELLQKAINSIEKQWYSNWELCIADDASTNKSTLEYLETIDDKKIKITFLNKNLNISGASNEAFNLADGAYTALMDNDDELAPNALFEVVKAINNTDAEFIYSDEDKLNMDGTYTEPNFKPDFLPDLFLSQNYINHFCVIKTELIKQVSGWSKGMEGAQDYDLYLKVLEKTDKIHHIPEILYHWRRIPGSTAAVFSDKKYAQTAGMKAIQKALSRRGIDAEVHNGLTDGTYRIAYKISSTPLVSIIIPFRDRPELLEKCILSILEHSTYKNFELICINNRSVEVQTTDLIKELEQKDKRVKFFNYDSAFNYSAINNTAVTKYAKGEYIIFLNNDIEIITSSWIEELLMHATRDNIGCVGAKLYFPNGYIQHAGIVIAPYTDHALILIYSMMEHNGYGYSARAKCVNNYSALTAACMMIKKQLFLKVGGFDEKALAIAYNDVDLCLRLRDNGYRNIFTPFCEAYHNESASRGYEKTDLEIERREKEKFKLKNKHPLHFDQTDPHFNHNLNNYSVLSEIHPKKTDSFDLFIPKPFTQKITFQRQIKRLSASENLSIFSHYSQDSIIDDAVIYYIEALSKISDVIFVSTASKLNADSTECINEFCSEIIVKENIGYDFGAWKTGLISAGDNLSKYQNLILCNDSVFGPLFPLDEMFEKMGKTNADIWSVSDNRQIKHHLQSFFIVYTSKAFNGTVFKDFYDNFTIINDKQTLIVEKEIKFSQALKESGLNLSSYCKSADFDSYRNIMHHYWRDLIKNYHCPFIKRELLQFNPLGININDWKKIIKENTTYPLEIISSYLKKHR